MSALELKCPWFISYLTSRWRYTSMPLSDTRTFIAGAMMIVDDLQYDVIAELYFLNNILRQKEELQNGTK
jgi:hypothetical protein